MFDRFTDRARYVLGLARQEAQRFCHDYIGTEHVLLGILGEGAGVATDVLKALDLDLERLKVDVERQLVIGKQVQTMGQIPFTPKMRRALELALEESSSLGHNYIGTGHLLLGLVRQQEGIAAKVLRGVGVLLPNVREEILEIDVGSPETPGERIAASGPSMAALTAALDELRADNATLWNRIEELETRVRELETGGDEGST